MAFYKVGDKVKMTKSDVAYNLFYKGDIAIITGYYPEMFDNRVFYTINHGNNSFFSEEYFEHFDNEGYYYGFLADDA